MGSSGYVDIEYVREFAGGLTNVDTHFCQRGGAAVGRWLARGCVSGGLATVHQLKRVSNCKFHLKFSGIV